LYYTAQTVAERGPRRCSISRTRNFIDRLKTREKPIGTSKSAPQHGHVFIGNIALRTGEKLVWDPAKETFTNGSAEARAMLRREYRNPWSLPGL
jgi:hypothetical protein